MTKVIKLFFITFLLCFVLGCSNFTSQKRSDFQKIASFLDYDGTTFSINTTHSINKTLHCYKSSLEKQVAYSNEISSLAKRQIQAFISCLEYLALDSGIADIKGTGISSKKVDEFYYNKGFMLIDPQSKGFLWNLIGKENKNLGAYIESLPADETLMAGEVQVKLSSVLDKLKKCNWNNPQSFKLLQNLLALQLDQLIAALDGVWQFAIMDTANDDFIISLPDKDKKVFNFISLILGNGFGVKSKDGVIELKNVWGENGNLSIFIASQKISNLDAGNKVKENNSFRVVLTSQKDYLVLPNSTVKQVKDLPSYQSYSKNVNKNSIAYFYIQDKVKKSSIKPIKIKDLSLDLSFLDYGEVTGIYRTGEGFYLLQKNKLDWSSTFIADFSYISAFLVEAFADDIIKLLPKNLVNQLSLIGIQEEKLELKDNKLVSKTVNNSCQDNLGRLGVLINNYTKKHGKMFKDYQELLKNIPEAKDLFACPLDTNKRYIYLGPYDKNSNRKLPIVIDQPLSHKDSFNVLYLDGTVEFFELQDCKSFRRMVSFLHTRNFYNEEEFILLINRATALDELWKLE